MGELVTFAKRLEKYCLPLCLLIQGLLLFWRLDLLPVWGDEQNTLDIIEQPLRSIARMVGNDVHPPLYFFLLHFWAKLPWSAALIVKIRALSGIWAMATTVALYHLWLTPERRGRFLLLWSVSPCLILYGRMGRSYTMQLFLVCIALYWGMNLLREPGRRSAIGLFAIAGALLFYTHYVPALAIVGAVEALLLYRALRGADAWRAVIVSPIVIAVLYSPWLLTMHEAVKHALGREYYALASNPFVEQVIRLAYLAFSFTLGETPSIIVVACGALLAPLVVLALWRDQRPQWLPAVLIAGVIGYASVAHAVSFAFTPARLLFILPFYLILVTKRTWMAVALSCLSVISLYSYYRQQDFLNKGYVLPFDQIADIIQRDTGARPAQLIVNAPGLDTSPLTRRLTIQTGPRSDAEIIWVLDNRGDHTPPPGTHETWRGQFVPYSELDHLAMRLLRWPVQPTHVLALTKYLLH